MKKDTQLSRYTVYVRTDSRERITAIISSAFLPDPSGWIAIDEGCDDRFLHAQGNYLPGPLTTPAGVCRYKLENGVPAARTEAEMADDAAGTSGVHEPGDTELLMEIAADHEYRLCLMEMRGA